MATQYAFGKIVTNGLVLALDAADRNSYVSGSNIWTDISGNGFNSTMTGSVSYVNTYPQYFDYGNLSNYFIGNNSLKTSISTAITISSWIKVTNTSVRNFILNKYQTTAPSGYSFEVGTASGLWTNTLRFYAIGSTGNGYDQRASNNAIQQNVPIMVSVTLDTTTQQFSMYINGSSVAYTSGGGTIAELVSDWSQGTNTYALGSLRPAFALDSQMYQYNLLLYNRALSAAEVLQNYNAQKSRFGLT